MAFYPILLFISSFLSDRTLAIAIVFLAYIIFGIAMTGIAMSWFMSSIYFAGKEDASMYQSVHVSLTGLRGLIVPPLGWMLMKFVHYRAVFIVATIAFVVSAYLSLQLSKKFADE